MKWTKGKILTHAGVFGVALLVATLCGSSVFKGSAADGSDAAGTTGGASRARPDRPGRPAVTKSGQREDGGETFSSGEFKAAWDAIARRKLTVGERVHFQRELLRKWSKIDLEASLHAALSLNWDDNGGAELLLDNVFEEVFRDRPLEAWDLIMSGKFGLGAELIKEPWMVAIVDKHPMLVMSVLNDLPSARRGEVLKVITKAAAADPAMREEFLSKLCLLPQNGQLSTWMSETIRELGPSGTPAEVGEKLASAKSDQERTRYIHEFGLSLKKQDFQMILAEWEKLPPELQQRALRSVLLHADSGSDLPSLVGQMVRTGDWENIKDQGYKISEYGYKTGKLEELANWTMTLPEKPESRGLFHRAMEPYIVNDPVGAKVWIDRLHPGDWRRDQALAEYSRHVLWRMNDKDLSTWAIGSISDPEVRQHVIGVREAWARQKGVDP